MHRLNVLIHQERPFHQITLHQAFNAQGVFDVQVTPDPLAIRARLAHGRRTDLLVLDHGMPLTQGSRLLEQAARGGNARALMLVGKPGQALGNLGVMAREHGLWVLGELPWPLSTPALERLLQRLRLDRRWQPGDCRQTVMFPTHAR
ncbi:histidine kinase [Pseudomonas fulva]|nr:histidine kinase [Pseudomonas fulva]MBF8779841.1 histidine kinase [Pseudomonas fulva]